LTESIDPSASDFFLLTIDLIDVVCHKSIISIDPIDVLLTLNLMTMGGPAHTFFKGV
jgi:hypothetical protein